MKSILPGYICRPQKTGFIFLLTLFATACTIQPVRQDELRDPAMSMIQAAFARSVKQAQEDSRRAWRNGWTGNMVVNLVGGENVGLCYQWQELVYVGIQPALRKTGWQARGISINKGTYFEHHAVVVFNPKNTNPDNLLQNPRQAGVYVLDPWKSGEAQIFTLNDWLNRPLLVEVPAKITQLRQFTITGHKP